MTGAPRRRDLYDDWAERQRRKETVDAWRATVGDWCPGYLKAGHPSADLCADHPDEVQAGGAPTGQQYAVLCRSCNTSKRNRVRAQLRQLRRQSAVVGRSRNW